MTFMSPRNCLIGRQPILSNSERIVAYELLFRSIRSGNIADVQNATYSTANVINNTITGFGIENLLGEHHGYINLDHEMLMSDVIELLPKQQIVLELLETLEVNAGLIERCRDLKEKGFTLALDDHEYSPVYRDLYPLVDIVKVDLLQTPLERVAEMVGNIRPFPVRLLAEKVESREQFLACRDMHFDLFQGYFFARPSVLEKRNMDESGALLLKLLHMLEKDADTKEIENAIKSSSVLSYKLLLLANSVAYAPREPVENVGRALALVGRNQVKRWIQLAFFAKDNCQANENPMMDMAAVRAGFMEQLAMRHPLLSRMSDAPDKAFMVGILSLLEKIYSISIAELIQRLNLGDDIQAALAGREGVYGELLNVAEKNEELELDTVGHLLSEMGISMGDALVSQVSSYAWNSDAADDEEEGED